MAQHFTEYGEWVPLPYNPDYKYFLPNIPEHILKSGSARIREEAGAAGRFATGGAFARGQGKLGMERELGNIGAERVRGISDLSNRLESARSAACTVSCCEPRHRRHTKS